MATRGRVHLAVFGAAMFFLGAATAPSPPKADDGRGDDLLKFLCKRFDNSADWAKIEVQPKLVAAETKASEAVESEAPRPYSYAGSTAAAARHAAVLDSFRLMRSTFCKW